MQSARKHMIVASSVLAIGAGAAGVVSPANGSSAARHLHRIDPSDFTNRIDNPYLPLKPGTKYHYRGDQGATNPVTVTHKTRKILGVVCVAVRDIGKVNGRAEGRALDFYAQDERGNVWYFGELSKQLEHGRWVRQSDTWEAGVHGAKAGIIMEAHPHKGDSYRQEKARHAHDRAKVLGQVHHRVTVPYGTFRHVLKIKEFSRIEPGQVDYDFYARGIGAIKEVPSGGGKSQLVSVGH